MTYMTNRESPSAVWDDAAIRLVVFDFDGTIGDTRRNIVLTMRQVMERLHMPVASEEICASTIGLPLKDCFRTIYPALTDDGAERCAECYRELFFANAKKLVPQLFPHVLETMEELRRHGVTLAIASSRTSQSLQGFVDDMGLRGLVAMVIGSDEVTRHKPDPEPVTLILDKLGFSAAETLVVGDMPLDIQMGHAAGCHTCAVTYGNATRHELQNASPDLIIDDMSLLLRAMHLL